MQGKHLYEYAVIRVLPKIEREEFINVGIILFSKRAKFIQVLYHINDKKLICFNEEIDLEMIRSILETFSTIAEGKKEGGEIAQLDIPERFRWLTAVKSSCVQTSRPHSGFSENLKETTEKLFKELVL